MEKIKKLFKNKVFNLIIGLIVGFLVSFITSSILETKRQKYENEKIKNEREYEKEKIAEEREKVAEKEMTELLYNRLNSRFYWAQNVLTSSKSDKVLFENRWDIYLEKGHMPWQIDRFRFSKFFKEKNPALYEKIDKMDSEFVKLHDLLLEVRRVVIYDSTSKERTPQEKEYAWENARKQNVIVKELKNKINEELMK